jgi:hypothetical protein
LLGLALVIVALVVFPMRLPLQTQPGDVDYYGVGWLFAPILGVWGMASLTLGLTQCSITKKKVESFLLPVFAIVTVGLAYASYMAIVFGSGIWLSVGRGEPLWLIYFAVTLVPSAIVFAATAMFLRAESKLRIMLSKKSLRAGLFTVAVSTPVVYSASLLLFLRMI